MQEAPRYWFPAKRYGWGWGPPRTWQGWLTVAVFVILLAAGAYFFPPHRRTLGYAIYVSGLSALLVTVCWIKGEPPHWRWGNRR